MSGDKKQMLFGVAFLALLSLSCNAMAGQAMSRILENEPTPTYHKPRMERPPYSAVLDEAHHILVGLGSRQDSEFELLNKHGKDVLAFFGPASRSRFGENDESLYCYVASRPGDGTAIVFVVYPDWLMRVHVQADKSRILKLRERCQDTLAVSSAVRTKGGLRLGMSRVEVLAIFGPPHRHSGNSFEYSSERPARKGEFGTTVWRSQQIWFDNNARVSGFSILANTLD